MSISSLRKYATGWVGAILLALFGLPFVFSGVYSYVGGGEVSVVAEVDGREIQQREYTRAYQEYRQRLQAMLGPNFRPELLDDRQLRQEALNRLIEEILITGTALDAGFRVSDAELARRITTLQAFQTDGRFDRDLYLQRVASQGRTPEAFEQELRTELLMQQLLDGVRASAFVTDSYLERAVRLQEQQRELSYARLPVERLLAGIEPDAAALEAFYQERAALFETPEQLRLGFLELSVDRLADGVGVDEATLQRLYDEQAASYSQEEERRARHILVALPAGGDDAARSAARAEAEALRGRLLAGESFAELARTESDDPGSAEQGGDLGFFGRGIMDPAFEAAAFTLAPNSVSEPVLSAFGYHLIEVTETRGGERKPFAELRDQLAGDYRRQQAEQLFFEQSETLANLAYEHPDSLEPAAEALGLEVAQSPWLSRDGGDWPLAQPRVLEAAFSEEVRAEGVNSQILELANDHLLVVRVAERRAARRPPLDEVREAVSERYRAQRARELAREQGEALLAQLRAGTSLTALAAAERLEQVALPALRRDDREQPQELVNAVFQVPRPAAGEIGHAGVPLANGDYVLIELTAVNDGELAARPQAESTELRGTLQRLHGSAELAGVVGSLRQRADVRVNSGNL